MRLTALGTTIQARPCFASDPSGVVDGADGRRRMVQPFRYLGRTPSLLGRRFHLVVYWNGSPGRRWELWCELRGIVID